MGDFFESLDKAVANLETVARLTTVDYNGEEQVMYIFKLLILEFCIFSP